MNSGVPSTDWPFFETSCSTFAVDSPKSPILKSPDAPLMKMLSHLMSRWMILGVCSWRYFKALRIWRIHLLIIFQRTTWTFWMKRLSEPDDRISVMKQTSPLSLFTHDPWKSMMFSWSSRSRSRTSLITRAFSFGGMFFKFTTFHATSMPSTESYLRARALDDDGPAAAPRGFAPGDRPQTIRPSDHPRKSDGRSRASIPARRPDAFQTSL